MESQIYLYISAFIKRFLIMSQADIQYFLGVKFEDMAGGNFIQYENELTIISEKLFSQMKDDSAAYNMHDALTVYCNFLLARTFIIVDNEEQNVRIQSMLKLFNDEIAHLRQVIIDMFKEYAGVELTDIDSYFKIFQEGYFNE